MGWYQDNFPGSPAQRQRILLSRLIVIYSLITGGLVYFLSPLCRRVRKEFSEGRVLEPNSPWWQERIENRRVDNRNFFSSKPTLEEFYKVVQEKEKRTMDDIDGPPVSTDILRSSHNRHS